MSLVEKFCQGQQISHRKTVRVPPLFVVVGTADRDGMEGPLLTLVFPDGYLHLRHAKSFYGLFVICHESFSSRVEVFAEPRARQPEQALLRKRPNSARPRRRSREGQQRPFDSMMLFRGCRRSISRFE